MAKDKSKLSEKLKSAEKIINKVWVIGTVLIFVIVITTIVFNCVNANKAEKQANIMQGLIEYNQEYLGYTPNVVTAKDELVKQKASVPDEVIVLVEELRETCEVEYRDYYTGIFIEVYNPEDTDSIVERLSGCTELSGWIVNDYGNVIMGNSKIHGTQEELPVFNSTATNFDDFYADLRTCIDNEETVMFVSKYTVVWLTEDLLKSIKADEFDNKQSRVVLDRVLTSIGSNNIELMELLNS